MEDRGWGLNRDNKEQEGQSQRVRARRVTEVKGRGRLFLLRLAEPEHCCGLGVPCLFETRENSARVTSSKSMKWGELKEA